MTPKMTESFWSQNVIGWVRGIVTIYTSAWCGLKSKTELVLEENASKEAKKTKNTRSEMDPKYAEEAKVFFSDIGFAERLVEEALKEQE